MEKQDPKPTTTIRVDIDWKTHLEAHGRYGERHQDILNRLMGDAWKVPTGDGDKTIYSADDVDSKKTKKERRKPTLRREI